MKKLPFLISIIFLLGLQEARGIHVGNDSTNTDLRNRLGVSGSSLSGYGLTFLKPITKSTYLGITGILAYYESEFNSTLYSSIGIEYQVDIKKNQNGRFFSGFGAGGYSNVTDRAHGSDLNDKSIRLGTFIGYENPSSKLVQTAFTINYFAIIRDRITYVGIGGGIMITIPLGKN